MTSKYHKKIARDGDGLSDVYDVLRAYGVADPAVAHAVKKLLAPGQRSGGKSYLQDLQEAAWSLGNAIHHAKAGGDPALVDPAAPMPTARSPAEGWLFDEALNLHWTDINGKRCRIWRHGGKWCTDIDKEDHRHYPAEGLQQVSLLQLKDVLEKAARNG